MGNAYKKNPEIFRASDQNKIKARGKKIKRIYRPQEIKISEANETSRF